MAKSESTPGPTNEQLKRVMDLQEKLLEVALEESDPGGWMNAEKAEEEARQIEATADEVKDEKLRKIIMAEAKMVRQQWKGQRYWEKKNATATVSLLTKLEMYRQRIEEGRQPGKLGGGIDDDEKVAADMKEAEAKVTGRIKKARLSIVKQRAV